VHDCPFHEHLPGLLAEQLSPELRATLEAHLLACPTCPEALDRLTESPELVGWRPFLRPPGFRPPGINSDTAVAALASDQAFLDALKVQLRDSFPALPLHGRRNSDDDMPAAIGGYAIHSRLGSGGMGVVYEGYDARLKRRVAVKVLRASIEGHARLRLRVHREAEAIAQLRHPNIVAIHEIGEQDGRPFLVFEFVEGGTLAEATRGQPQAPAEAAALVQTLAEAIHFAHQRGIIHRDLKPSNILLTAGASAPSAERNSTWLPLSTQHITLSTAPDTSPRDATGLGTPKISDFGLAKDLNEDVQVSRTGDILGTPNYMAPEQASGSTRDVGPGVDVYALGVILYELLTGRPPFRANSLLETLELVRTQEPVPPGRLRPMIPPDLETICLKCLHKEPTRRYASAQALADDLQRFRNSEPIHARPVSDWERARKWVQRRPGQAATLAAAVLFLTLGSAASTHFGLSATRNAALAEDNAREARTQEKAARSAEDRAKIAEKNAQRDAARLRLEKGLALAEQGEVAPGLHWMLASLRSTPAEDADFQRMVRTNLAAWDAQLLGLRLALPREQRIIAGALSADGRLIATGHHDGTVRISAAATGKALHILPHTNSICSVAFSPDGGILVVGCASPAGTAEGPTTARLWDVATGKAVGDPLPHIGNVTFVGFNPAGTTLLTVSVSNPPVRCTANEVHLWDARSLKPIAPAFEAPGKLRTQCWDLDGKTVLTLSEDKDANHLIRWDAATGKRAHEVTYPAKLEYSMVLGPSGKTLITTEFATFGQTGRPSHPVIRQRDLATARELGAPTIHSRTWRIGRLAVTPDGRTILAGSDDGILTGWDAATGQLQFSHLAHTGEISCVAVHDDGKTILTTSYDGTAKVWELSREVVRAADQTWGVKSTETGPRLMQPEYNLTGHHAAFTPDRNRVLARDSAGEVSRLWDVASGWPALPPLKHQWKQARPVIGLSPNGKVAATCSHPPEVAGEVSLWNTATGQRLHAPLKLSNYPGHFAFSPDGRLLATGDYHRKLRFWDVATGEEVGEPIALDDIVLAVAFSPDGRTLATGTANEWAKAPHAQLWDVATRRPLGKPMPCRNHVVRVMFSPDGKRVLTGALDNTVRLWDAATGQPRSEPLAHSHFAAVTFSPDGGTFLTGSGDGSARLWDTATGNAVPGGAMAHPYPVVDVAFAPDGKRAAIGCADGTTRLWDLATFKPLGPALAHRSAELRGAAFVSGGTSIATVVSNGPPRLWPVPSPDQEPDLDTLALRLQVRTGLRMDAGGIAMVLSPEEWLAQRQQPGATGSPPRSASDALWHDARARDAEQDGDIHAALWHLDRLLKERPKEWVLHARRARALNRAGRPEDARAASAQAVALGADRSLLDW